MKLMEKIQRDSKPLGSREFKFVNVQRGLHMQYAIQKLFQAEMG